MASKLIKLQISTVTTTNLSTPSPRPESISQFLPPHQTLRYRSSSVSFSPRPKLVLSVHCSLSPRAPPKTLPQAITQANTCLSVTLAKPLENIKRVGKVKKLTQARFQVEIPMSSETPETLLPLAAGIFRDLTVATKGSPVNVCILWPGSTLEKTGLRESLSVSPPWNVEHVDFSSVKNGDGRYLASADVVAFVAPEKSQVADIKSISDRVFPKPVVIFNPGWLTDMRIETDFGELSGFVRSFEVIYSFLVMGVESGFRKRTVVLFKCVRDGVVREEKWNLLVGDEKGKMKAVSSFKERPSVPEVQDALYNAMAIDSPITKSARFLRDLVSNITGKKS